MKNIWTPGVFIMGVLLLVADMSWRMFGPSPYRFDFLVDSTASQGTVIYKVHGIQQIGKIDNFEGRFHRNERIVDRFSLKVGKLSQTTSDKFLSTFVPFRISCIANDGNDGGTNHAMPCVLDLPNRKFSSVLSVAEKGVYSDGLTKSWYWKRPRLARFDGELDINPQELKSLLAIDEVKIQLQIEGYSEKYGKLRQ